MDPALKLKTWNEIKEIVLECHKNHKRVIFTNGCFDILHAGHVAYLCDARKMGDVLIVGLNSDDSIHRLKGNSRPVNQVHERAYVLGGLESIDYIVIFEEDTPYELIKVIEPDVLVKGGDWLPEKIIGYDIVIAKGGIVESMPYREGFSTSDTIGRILDLYRQEIPEANIKEGDTQCRK